MKKSKQSWAIGDVFLVPCQDGQYVVGQIVGREAEVLNSVTCAFFDIRVSEPSELAGESLVLAKLFSVLFVTRESLDRGDWRIMENRMVDVPIEFFPYEKLRGSRFVGAKVIGSGIVEEFLNAFYALVPWDNWKNPDYLDSLLISPQKKPTKLLLKGRPNNSGNH